MAWTSTACALSLLSLLLSAVSCKNGTYRVPEIEGYDGWYNNLAHPEWGGADFPLTRRLPPAFVDGVYQPSGGDRPNPLEIASLTMSGAKGFLSRRNRTALLTFFGQQMVEEILDVQRPGCPPEYFNIKIPKNHKLYNPHRREGLELPFLRSRYDKTTGQSPNNPRQQLNEITPWIDGGLHYGVTKAWADALRAFTNGELACNGTQKWDCPYPQYNTIGLPLANPPPPFDHKFKSAKRFFKIGNPRGNENPMLLTMGIMWFRNHNYHADRLKKQFERKGITCRDECLYNRARQWNIAEYQNIVLNVWLPGFLGSNISPYTGYKPFIHPGITHAFQSVAMRFGHTMVPPVAYRARVKNKACDFRSFVDDPHHSKSRDPTSVRTCNSYWKSPELVANGEGVDELAFGLAKQVTEREDNIITEDLRGFVFGSLDFSRRDLMALNIQRARDHGLPDYNTAREVYGLPRITKFEDINPMAFKHPLNPEFESVRSAITNMSKLYNLKNIDMWPGGLFETVDSPGPLFFAIIRDQFERIRDGDRFWFENTQNGLFSEEEIKTIKNTTFRDILVRNIHAAWFKPDMLQQDVFHYSGKSDEIWPAFKVNGCAPAENVVYNESNLNKYAGACSPLKTFDYFDGSEGPYIGTFVVLGMYLILNFAIMIMAVRYYKQKNLKSHDIGHSASGADIWLKAGVFSTTGGIPMVCDELQVPTGARKIVIAPTLKDKVLKIYDAVSGSIVRTIDLAHIPHVEMQIADNSKNAVLHNGVLLIRFATLYDIVMRFPGSADPFCHVLTNFLENIGIAHSCTIRKEKDILHDSFTKEDRQTMVEEFFRLLFRESLAENGSKKHHRVLHSLRKGRSTKKKRQILELELTKDEFAEAMGMKANSIFVQQVFKFVDEDNSGTVSFQEFLKFLVLFTTGSSESKIELMFNIYDIDGSGTLERSEFTDMLKHLIEQANESVDLGSLEAVVTSILQNAGLEDKEVLELDDFKRMFTGYQKELNDAAVQVHGKTAGKSSLASSNKSTSSSAAHKVIGSVNYMLSTQEKTTSKRDRLRSRSVQLAAEAYINRDDERAKTTVHIDPLPVEEEIGDDSSVSGKQQKVLATQRIWENYRLHIFWFVLYELVVLAIFAERAYYYSVEREHAGLRRIAGYGVTVTRGAASAMMFTYSSLLVTMSRNIITKLRETVLNYYIPFDAAHAFHKMIAITALLFTVVHCVGHAINFYHISTQTPNDLTCLFREYYHLSHELPKFQFWMFNTLTGVAGFLLVLVVITIYVFAMPYTRRFLFKTFWYTHHLYIMMYILLILHGSGRLVQPALFQWYFVLPASVFALDKLISYSRKKVELVVYKAEKLPSGVTHLQFKKPLNFDYRSGQWVRIACLALNSQEYHPFTLTSAPVEPTLDLYIRAVGPWTQNLRTVYDPENPKNHNSVTGNLVYPRLYLDGPFGEGHQEWYKFPIAVLVGGGIGVTPFASILKDLVYKEQLNAHLACKKVYFLWVTRTQKQFEWMTDIIRHVEEQDKNGLTDIHIFITQFYQKFDLRTIMLYICERHFQKVSNRSLFSGLRSITHFGRPQFDSFFEGLQELHCNIGQIGVFSCGPPPMTRSVEAGCSYCNQCEGPVFMHHYENF